MKAIDPNEQVKDQQPGEAATENLEAAGEQVVEGTEETTTENSDNAGAGDLVD